MMKTMTSPRTGACFSGEESGNVWPDASPAAELLGRSAHGDETAFAEFFDSTCQRVLGLVMTVVRDRAMAEEVTREAYIYLWRHSARIEPDVGSATAWITTVAFRGAVKRNLQLRGPEALAAS